jgi:hypothetical protein
MSERITEAELQDVERAAAPIAAYAPGVGESMANLARGVLRYISEVHRLRGLIVAAGVDPFDTNSSPETCSWCSGGDWAPGVEPRDGTERHVMNCPWPALEAEARAIREEQGNG